MRDAALKVNHNQLNKKEISESTVKTQRQRSEKFTKIVFIADNIYISIKSINKTLIIILF